MDSVINNFDNDCKVISLVAEYEGYTGKERYAIITDLTEDELNARYSKRINRFRPFIILTKEMGEVITEHTNCEKKHDMRIARGDIYLHDIDDYELIHLSLFVDDDQTIRERNHAARKERQRINRISRKALMTLTPKQRDYLYRHYILNMTIRDIAAEDGLNRNTVWEIFSSGRKKYKKAVEALEVA